MITTLHLTSDALDSRIHLGIYEVVSTISEGSLYEVRETATGTHYYVRIEGTI